MKIIVFIFLVSTTLSAKEVFLELGERIRVRGTMVSCMGNYDQNQVKDDITLSCEDALISKGKEVACVSIARKYNLSPEQISSCGHFSGDQNTFSCISFAGKYNVSELTIIQCKNDSYGSESVECMQKVGMYGLNYRHVSWCKKNMTAYYTSSLADCLEKLSR